MVSSTEYETAVYFSIPSDTSTASTTYFSEVHMDKSSKALIISLSIIVGLLGFFGIIIIIAVLIIKTKRVVVQNKRITFQTCGFSDTNIYNCTADTTNATYNSLQHISSHTYITLTISGAISPSQDLHEYNELSIHDRVGTNTDENSQYSIIRTCSDFNINSHLGYKDTDNDKYKAKTLSSDNLTEAHRQLHVLPICSSEGNLPYQYGVVQKKNMQQKEQSCEVLHGIMMDHMTPVVPVKSDELLEEIDNEPNY